MEVRTRDGCMSGLGKSVRKSGLGMYVWKSGCMDVWKSGCMD